MPYPGPVATVEEPNRVGIAFWREILSAVDYAKMKLSPVYYGLGVPHGNGEPVIVIPGFLGCDLYLLELYFWLRRVGYTPYLSHIGQNAECPDLLTSRLLNTLNYAYKQTGQKVHLVGHSLGGVLARGVAARRPDRVASVIMLGAPFRGVRVNPFIYRAIEYVRHRIHGRRCRGKQCFTTACACGFTCTMRYTFPSSVLQTAIYTRNDGVVDWPVCINDDPETDFEVSSTHIGLVWNAASYRIIAERLHEAEERLCAMHTAQSAKRVSSARRRARARKTAEVPVAEEIMPTPSKRKRPAVAAASDETHDIVIAAAPRRPRRGNGTGATHPSASPNLRAAS